MSTIAVANEPLSLILSIFVGMAVSVGLAWRAGVFAPASVCGPRRWDDESGGGGTMIGLFGIGVAIYMLVAVAWKLATEGATDALPASTQPALSSGQLLASVTAQLVTVAGVLIIGSILRKRNFMLLGLTRSNFMRAIVPAGPGIVMILFPTLVIGMGAILVFDRMGIEHETEHEMLRYLRETPDPMVRWIIFISAWVVAPLAEEVLFRGHLQTGIASAIAPKANRAAARWFAIFFASILFAWLHPWWSRAPIIFLSLCLGYAYERTGNLWLCVLLHAAFNFIQTMLFLGGLQEVNG